MKNKLAAYLILSAVLCLTITGAAAANDNDQGGSNQAACKDLPSHAVTSGPNNEHDGTFGTLVPVAAELNEIDEP
jgi:hypothetical protein